ncbi:antitoxin VapB family protein [Halorussus salilacus]|uniref:antitoxin VapB family protein n=1 Tax=Halorussus salilacus TaxID=2953750 RepID=UPI0020A09986|nr:antitoxin VapB family protein [Halorussus salilacus]USZ67271.1 antitoxin VapB family protein [Halorussus salilacus]
MGTKTIGLRDDVYERLKSRKREGESFTDLMDRLMDETTPDWREGFGTLSEGEADELESFVRESREATAEGLSTRQIEALGVLSEVDDDDETA